MTTLSYEDGRVWFQPKKFQPYTLLLPYGMTDVTDTTGSLNAVREGDAGKRRSTVVVDILRGEPGLVGFSLTTRLQRTRNFMLGLRNKTTSFQAHLGACGRPDRYDASDIGLGWEGVLRGDLSIDQVAILQGDNAPIGMTVPFMAQTGPTPIDFSVEFLSRRTIGELDDATAIAMIKDACDDPTIQDDPGDNGYLATVGVGGSPTDQANVWFTTDAGESWAEVQDTVPAITFPFEAGEDISDIVVLGEMNKHRVIVARGTTDLINPAGIAYADVTVMGTVTWVNVDVGNVLGQIINKIFWLDWGHVFAVTDDGYVYTSRNGGATWEAQLTNGVVNLADVTALADGTVWVVGDANTLFHSESFGNSWNLVDGAVDGAVDDNTAVHVTPDGTLYVGNDVGALYGTYNNGASWNTLPLQGVTALAVRAIEGDGNSHIWVVADLLGTGRVLRSTDGGATFLLWSLNIPPNSGLNDIDVIDLNYVFTAGDAHDGTAFVTKTDPQIIGL